MDKDISFILDWRIQFWIGLGIGFMIGLGTYTLGELIIANRRKRDRQGFWRQHCVWKAGKLFYHSEDVDDRSMFIQVDRDDITGERRASYVLPEGIPVDHPPLNIDWVDQLDLEQEWP